MLKVQDGCHNFCTYCIIPYARGPVRSMALEPAVDQARGVSPDVFAPDSVCTRAQIVTFLYRALKP